MFSIRGAKSNWRSGLARAGLIASLLLGSVTLAADQHDGSHSSTPTERATQQPPLPAPPTNAQTSEAYIYSYSCERPKNAEQDNLCTARKAADAANQQVVWARNTFWLGVAGTFFVILTLAATSLATYASLRSAAAALSSVRVSEKTLAVSQRPWLFVEIGKIELMQVISKEKFYLNLELSIKNIGNTPA